MAYEVVGLLGRGGSAVVELAVDGAGRRVATKRIVLGGSAEAVRVARLRLRREARLLGRLDHPGIVPVLDVIDDGSDILLVLPALAENLTDRVARLGPIPVADLLGVGRVLFAALAEAHRHGIVHRDIKPANVLFDADGRPALADFGAAASAELTDGLTEEGTVVGTPLWMAPEQARGEGAGPASDVFSLAATLRFAGTGIGPYQHGPSSFVVAQAARGGIIEAPPWLPEPLAELFAALLDPEPVRRPSAAAVCSEIDACRPTLPAGPVAPWPARRSLDPAGAGVADRRPPAAPLPAAPLPAAPLPIPHRGLRRVDAVAPVRSDALPAAHRRTSQRSRPGRRRRRWMSVAALAAALALLVAGVLLVDAPGGSGRPRRHLAACVPLRFEPCGAPGPAPHTNGRTCDPGWYDLAGDPAAGCPDRSDYLPGTPFPADRPLHANLVPLSATDSYTVDVPGDVWAFCWGSLRVTLRAPSRTAEKVSVWKGSTLLADAVSAGGAPATATVHKPSCFAADAETLRVVVGLVAATGAASAEDFTLTRSAGW